MDVHGAVATDNTNCSQIGTKLLRRGGNAVDAAVAATLCMAVVAPHKTSLGRLALFFFYYHNCIWQLDLNEYPVNIMKEKCILSPSKSNFFSIFSGGYVMIYSHTDQEKPIVIDFLSNTLPGSLIH